VEALIEATSPQLGRDSAETDSTYASGPPLLPITNVQPPRPWIWQVLLDRRRGGGGGGGAATARTGALQTAVTAAGHPVSGVLRHGGGGSGSSRGSRRSNLHRVRVMAGSPTTDEEEGRGNGGGGAGDVQLPSPSSATDDCGKGDEDDPGGGGGTGGRDLTRNEWVDVAGVDATRAAHAVATKTFSALVRKYAALSQEQEAEQLKLASKFGKGASSSGGCAAVVWSGGAG